MAEPEVFYPTQGMVHEKRLLIAEVKRGSKTKAILSKFGVSKLPTLMVLPRGEGNGEGDGDGGDGSSLREPVRFQKKVTFNKLSSFLYDFALKKSRKKKGVSTVHCHNLPH